MELSQKLDFIIEVLEDKKANNIKVVDASPKVLIDKFIICDGSSNTHLKTIYQHLKKSLREENIAILNVSENNNSESGWFILDIGEIVIHIMRKEKRHFYELEDLWESYLADEQ
ncbi:MAG: ribosome silencing factor [Candidatus Muiribacteriota bacterium]